MIDEAHSFAYIDEPEFRARLGSGYDLAAGSQLLAERAEDRAHDSIFTGVYTRLIAAFLFGALALLAVVGLVA